MSLQTRLNLFITSVGADIKTLTTATADSGWINATYQNGWFSYDVANWGAASYRKIGRVVYIRGWAGNNDSSGVNTGKTVFTLPVGYRPAVGLIFNSYDGAGLRKMQVLADGQVSYPGNTVWGSWASLVCSFPAS